MRVSWWWAGALGSQLSWVWLVTIVTYCITQITEMSPWFTDHWEGGEKWPLLPVPSHGSVHLITVGLPNGLSDPNGHMAVLPGVFYAGMLTKPFLLHAFSSYHTQPYICTMLHSGKKVQDKTVWLWVIRAWVQELSGWYWWSLTMVKSKPKSIEANMMITLATKKYKHIKWSIFRK